MRKISLHFPLRLALAALPSWSSGVPLLEDWVMHGGLQSAPRSTRFLVTEQTVDLKATPVRKLVPGRHAVTRASFL